MLNATTTFSFFSLSTLRLRYALLISKLPPLLCFPSRQYSHSLLPSLHKVSAFDNHNVDNAVASYNHMLCMSPTSPMIEFGKILGSLVRMKRYPTAISLSKQLELKGIVPDIVTLSILINSYCHIGQMAQAFSVFAKILKLGYLPDTITLTTLMKGLCLNGEVEKALDFHDRVVAQGSQFDVVSHATLINGLCKIGQAGVAIQMLRKIERQGIKPDVVMYSIIIDRLK